MFAERKLSTELVEKALSLTADAMNTLYTELERHYSKRVGEFTPSRITGKTQKTVSYFMLEGPE